MTSRLKASPISNFFKAGSTKVPCLGLALGRQSLWASMTGFEKAGDAPEWSGRFPLEGVFSAQGSPLAAPVKMEEAAGAVRQKLGDSFFDLQVALPDAAVRLEVLSLDKLPPRGKALEDFLTWRFNGDRNPDAPALAFTTQALGEEDGKPLLMALAVERGWLSSLTAGLRAHGLYPSVVDMALAYRFNRLYSQIQGKGAGALAAFEPDYWSLAVWDKETRPRFLRSKWWDTEKAKVKDLPLEETVLEMERTLRSYVYSGKNRDVESLFVTAPEDWLEPVRESLDKKSGGLCAALPLPGGAGSPSAAAVAVRR